MYFWRRLCIPRPSGQYVVRGYYIVGEDSMSRHVSPSIDSMPSSINSAPRTFRPFHQTFHRQSVHALIHLRRQYIPKIANPFKLIHRYEKRIVVFANHAKSEADLLELLRLQGDISYGKAAESASY
ncbi:hypothetical protein Droror1_Dr00013818 [Drosera rotundifolia]